jgi:hypothetical protein
MRGISPAILVALSLAAASASAIAQSPPPGDKPAAPPAAPAAPPKVPTGENVPPPSVTVIDPVEARGILGREVRSAADENMGRVVDVLVDRNGQVRAAIIDFGGFLGVGSRKIAVDWNAVHLVNAVDKDGRITLELTRDQVKAAPEYADGKPVVVLGASGNLEPLRFPPAAPPEK